MDRSATGALLTWRSACRYRPRAQPPQRPTPRLTPGSGGQRSPLAAVSPPAALLLLFLAIFPTALVVRWNAIDKFGGRLFDPYPDAKEVRPRSARGETSARALLLLVLVALGARRIAVAAPTAAGARDLRRLATVTVALALLVLVVAAQGDRLQRYYTQGLGRGEAVARVTISNPSR